MFHPRGPTFGELVRQALSSTERGYDLLSPKFEYTPFCTPHTLLDRVAPYIGGPGSIENALDVCCGTGTAMRMLRPLCRSRVVGLDFSQGMLDHGQRLTRDAPGTAALEFVRGNALNMPFQDEFDVAVCFGALGHFLPRDQPVFLSQVARALKPGGRFLFASSQVPSLWSRRYWLSRTFNAAMRVRNKLIAPPFIMYYLQFLLPEVAHRLRKQGFQVVTHKHLFEDSWPELHLIVATLSHSSACEEKCGS